MNAKNKKAVNWCKGILGAALLATPVFASAATVEGTARLTYPVAHSTIQVLDPSGNLVAQQADATNEDGYYRLSVQADSLEGYHVQATGGEYRGHSFEGTLYGTPEKGLEGQPAWASLNAVTTLQTRYQQLTGVNSQQAETRVREFLQIPNVVDFSVGLDNPYLTVFSSAVFESDAEKAGGLDRYTEELALEMSKGTDATHPFVAEQGLQSGSNTQFVEWIGEKLLAGMVGNIGSQIFSKLQNAIGIPDQQTEIFNKLNQVIAQLAEITKKLDVIETAVYEAEHDVRAGNLWASYGDYITWNKELTKLNTKALNNKSGDPQIAKDVKDGAAKIKAAILLKDMSFITQVHQAFVTPSDINALQKIFSRVKYGQMAPIIDKSYFDLVQEQVDRYRTYQVIAATMLVDAVRADNQTLGDAKLETTKEYTDEEKVIFPDKPFFKKDADGKLVYQNLINRIRAPQEAAKQDKPESVAGQALFDDSRNAVWDTSYKQFNSCYDMLMYRKDRKKGDFGPASNQQIRELVVDAKKSGRFSGVVKDLGFKQADADGIKMIVTNCELGNVRYQWFGNDQTPWDDYNDSLTQFEKVRKDKKMPTGVFTMKVTPLE